MAGDDYYLATDTARAVQGTGAEMIGPFSTGEDAEQGIAENVPTGAVIDTNLGGRPLFKLAATLRRQGTSFSFITGYGDKVIPPHFSGVPRLQKPTELEQIVGTLAALLNSAT